VYHSKLSPSIGNELERAELNENRTTSTTGAKTKKSTTLTNAHETIRDVRDVI
jgi:hypothetical protein